MTQKTAHEKPITLPASAIRRLWRIFAAVLAASVLAQFFVTPHPYFNIDGQFWFYPVYGLLASMLMVLAAKLIGFFLKRPEDYWNRKKGGQ